MKKAKILLLPSSGLGKKTLLLTFLFWIFFAIFWLVIKAGYRGGDTYWSQPALAIPFTIAGICGVSAFFTGLISVIKEKERSGSAIQSTGEKVSCIPGIEQDR